MGELLGTKATSPSLLEPSSESRTFNKTSCPLEDFASTILPSSKRTLISSINVP